MSPAEGEIASCTLQCPSLQAATPSGPGGPHDEHHRRCASREFRAPVFPGGHRFFTMIFGADLMILFDFTVMVASAIALRHRSDWHKRLMLLATCSIIMPPIARLPVNPPEAFALFYACVLVPVIVDTVRHRRLRPAFGWCAPQLIASEQVTFYAAQTPAWTQFVIRLFA